MRAKNILRWASACSAMCLASVTLAAPGTTDLISARNASVPLITANGFTFGGAISPNGRYIAFSSRAADIVAGDTNNFDDIFVYDRVAGSVERVSVGPGGVQADGDSSGPAISADGRYVAFSSTASNLGPGGGGEWSDVFVHDRQTHQTTRASVSSTGQGGTGGGLAGPGSFGASISADGRFVAFTSYAENFGPLPTDMTTNVYVRDRQSGTTKLASANASGTPGDRSSSGVISPDGRYVVFTSEASNLVPGDTNGVDDSFVLDRQTEALTRVSVSSSGTQGNGQSGGINISGNGRYVTFWSNASNLVVGDTNNAPDVFVRDRQTGVTQRVNVSSSGAEAIGLPGSLGSVEPSISSDGRYVVFRSGATNLVAGDTNNVEDIFLRDRQTGTTTRINLNSSLQQTEAPSFTPTMSPDARYILYVSASEFLIPGDHNLAYDLFLRDRQTATTSAVSKTSVSSKTAPGESDLGAKRVVSADGRFVVFVSPATALVENDTNTLDDVFVRDRQTGVTTLASVDSAGEQADGPSLAPTISANGRYVAFQSLATNLVSDDTNNRTDVFVHDLQTGQTSRASVASNGAQGDNSSFDPVLSADGRYVAFASSAGNLAPGDINSRTDVFVRDRQSGVTQRVSVGAGSVESNADTFAPSMSADGRYVAFQSDASNLIPGDTNNHTDVFVRDRQAATTSRVSVGSGGIQGTLGGAEASISANGRYVSFTSSSENLVPDDTNGLNDVFVHDRQTAVTRRVSVDSTGASANTDSGGSTISADGRYVTFETYATNLVAHDTNNDRDVFVHDRLKGTTSLISVSSSGVQGQGNNHNGSISNDGGYVAFVSTAPNLVAADFNAASDVFAHQRTDVPVVRVNVGGAGFTDSRGLFWESDRGFNTGGVSTYAAPIAGTVDDALYQTERWDQDTAPELQYSFAVPNGEYLVRLHFAENYVRNFGVGRRVFDVDMEGAPKLDNVDVFAEAGAQRALVKTATVNVTDGQLNILFRHQVQSPMVNAIEVIGR